MSFPHHVERDEKLSFLDANVFHKEGQFVTNVHRKPTFSGVYTHFQSFLPATYKFGMFVPLHIDVFEFVLIGQNLARNSGFLKVSF